MENASTRPKVRWSVHASEPVLPKRETDSSDGPTVYNVVET